MVLVPGICLCFIFYKHKILPQKKKSTISKSQRSKLPQNRQNIEIEENMYDNIDDTDLLEYGERIQISSDDINTINKSKTAACRNSLHIEKYDYSVQSLSTDGTHKQDFNHTLSGDDFSSNDEEQHEQIQNCITLATVHRIESVLPDHDIVSTGEHEYTFQYPIQMMTDTVAWPCGYGTS